MNLKDLAAFSKHYLYAFPKLASGNKCPKHIKFIADHIQAAINKDSIKDKMLMISVPPRHGKCLNNKTFLVMGDGSLKQLGDIEIGDYVYTHEGRSRKVLEIYEQGILDCIEVETKSGRRIITDLTHPFWTPDGWVVAADLVINNCLSVMSYYSDRDCDNSEKELCEARLAGYFVGDGCCTEKSYPRITCADEIELNDIKHCVNVLGFDIGTIYNKIEVPIRPAGMVKSWLKSAGLYGHNSYTKRVPQFIFKGSNELVANFIGAYFSCDGHINKRSGIRKDACVELYSVNHDFLKDVQHLLLRVGIQSTLRLKNGRYNNRRHVSYRLTMTSQDDVKRFYDRVPIYSVKKDVLAKWVLCRQSYDYPFIADKIVKITTGLREECRCLLVDEDHTFIANDFVVHNTELISKHLPAWYLGNNPKKRIILTSYSAELADDNSGAARDIFATWGPILWNTHPNKNVFSKSKWNTDKGGGVISAGIGGSITGFGADCLHGDTFILTNIGKKRIKDISIGDMVLSYSDDGLSYNQVLAKKTSTTKEIYEITIGENIVRATGNHRFFVFGKGYVKAKDLQEGYKVVSVTLKQDMYKMWAKKRRERTILSRLLCAIKEIRGRVNLRFLWKEVPEKIVRCKESKKKRLPIYILFDEMFSRSLSSKVWEEVCRLWRTCSKKDDEILFSGMSRFCKKRLFGKKDMPILQKGVYNEYKTTSMLFGGLCESSSFFEDVWRKKLELSSWEVLSNRIQKYKKRHYKKRWREMHLLQKSKTSSSSPQEQRYIRQFHKKFDNVVQFMSYDNAQIEEYAISRIRKVNVSDTIMYDIQVENDNNFFANDILVHNCLIIDDYCKGAEEAESKLANEKIWEWWQAVASTRLHPNSTTIILSTRWVSNDLVGRLLTQKQVEGDDFPFDLTYINLPALCEESGDPLGREPGDALWPWRYSRERLLNIQKKSGSYWWAALFQGNPVVRGGNLFKSEWFRYYDRDSNGDWLCYRLDEELPLRISKSDLRVSIIVDPALEVKRKNDPSCMLAWGYSRKHRVWLLLDRLNKKIPHQLIHNTILNFAFKNNAYQILVENEKIGKVIVKQAQGNDEISGVKIPFREVATGQKDKFSRATPMASYYESQRVFHPKGVPWIAQFEDNLGKFPSGDHDEDADCTAHAQTLEMGMSIADALYTRRSK